MTLMRFGFSVVAGIIGGLLATQTHSLFLTVLFGFGVGIAIGMMNPFGTKGRGKIMIAQLAVYGACVLVTMLLTFPHH